MSNNSPTQIALVQMRCGPEPDANLAHAIELIGDAAKNGAQIVCLPELFRSRYFCQSENHDNLSFIPRRLAGTRARRKNLAKRSTPPGKQFSAVTPSRMDVT